MCATLEGSEIREDALFEFFAVDDLAADVGHFVRDAAHDVGARDEVKVIPVDARDKTLLLVEEVSADDLVLVPVDRRRDEEEVQVVDELERIENALCLLVRDGGDGDVAFGGLYGVQCRRRARLCSVGRC